MKRHSNSESWQFWQFDSLLCLLWNKEWKERSYYTSQPKTPNEGKKRAPRAQESRKHLTFFLIFTHLCKSLHFAWIPIHFPGSNNYMFYSRNSLFLSWLIYWESIFFTSIISMHLMTYEKKQQLHLLQEEQIMLKRNRHRQVCASWHGLFKKQQLVQDWWLS
jgi:hypothetical protein